MSRFKIPNPKVVGLCVLAAATFWFLNAMSKNYTTTISIPLEIQYDQSKFIKVAKSSPHFEVKVNGQGWDLLLAYVGYNLDPCIYQADENKFTGTIEAPSLFQEVSQTLHDLKVNYVLKKNLQTGLEIKGQRKFITFVDADYLPLDGLTEVTGAIQCIPNNIMVSGPMSLLDGDSIGLTDFTNIRITDSTLTATASPQKNFSDLCELSDSVIKIIVPIQKYVEREKNVSIGVIGSQSKKVNLDFDKVKVKYIELQSDQHYAFKENDFYVLMSDWNPVDSTLSVKTNNLKLKKLDYQPKKVKFLGYE